MTHNGKAVLGTDRCQCEHIAHTNRDRLPRPTTPNGNPGHGYGVKFREHYLGKVDTPLGTFVVCKDCAEDCLADFVKGTAS